MQVWHKATIRALARHGITCTYSKEVEGAYDLNTSTTTNTITEYHVVVYQKHYVANQFNSPNLIGKDTALFYLSAYNLAFTPEVNDFINFNSKNYKIVSVMKKQAGKEIVLYELLGVV